VSRVAILEARDIAKAHGLRPVLRGVTLNVAAGEFVAVLGANGAGKTTLLRILATLSRPDAGSLAIGGADALRHPGQARRRIGFVSHHSLIYGDLTAAENLRFYADLYGVGRAGDASPLPVPARIEEALGRVNLAARARDPARAFSRGMLQRLTIARALLHDPALILLDEPFTGLDQASARALSELLRTLAADGRALVMTTHEFSRGLDGVTRAALIRGGRIADECAGGEMAGRVADWFA
jgi:heme exporter protein A